MKERGAKGRNERERKEKERKCNDSQVPEVIETCNINK